MSQFVSFLRIRRHGKVLGGELWPSAKECLGLAMIAALILLLPGRASAEAMVPRKICIDGGKVETWSGTINISGGGSATDANGVQYVKSESRIVNAAV